MMRIEVLKNSSLPAKLARYAPRLCSSGTRIEAGEFLPVDVIEISLPGK